MAVHAHFQITNTLLELSPLYLCPETALGVGMNLDSLFKQVVGNVNYTRKLQK